MGFAVSDDATRRALREMEHLYEEQWRDTTPSDDVNDQCDFCTPTPTVSHVPKPTVFMNAQAATDRPDVRGRYWHEADVFGGDAHKFSRPV